MAKCPSPLRTIRLKCLDCSCGSAFEVKLCPVINCVLYPYRFGKNPNRAGMGGNPPTKYQFSKKTDGAKQAI